MLQCVAVRCSVLHCVAVRCSVLQRVEVCFIGNSSRSLVLLAREKVSHMSPLHVFVVINLCLHMNQTVIKVIFCCPGLLPQYYGEEVK